MTITNTLRCIGLAAATVAASSSLALAGHGTPPGPLQRQAICGNLQAAYGKPAHFYVLVGKDTDARFVCPVKSQSYGLVGMRFENVSDLLEWTMKDATRHILPTDRIIIDSDDNG